MTLSSFDLLVPARTVFGWGRLAELPSLATPLGARALLVSGSRSLERDGTVERVRGLLGSAGIEMVDVGSIHNEPTVSDVDRLTTAARALAPPGARADFVIGIGGGAALDAAKALAAMIASRAESVIDFLEGVGSGLEVTASLPMLAIPTTSGTGSECTKNAVISSDPDDERRFKKSVRANCMVPRAVLIDPELTVSLPANVTAHSGMDAITQLVESLVSSRARPVPSALAREGLARALPSVAEAAERPESREAREAMAYAAYLSGIALANAGLGMAHGVAAALGSVCGVTHGLACAVMLPAALEANREARRSEIAFVGRELARCAGVDALERADETASAGAAPRLAAELNARLGIPSRLGELGVRAEDVPALVAGSRGNSMNGNPRPIDDDELGRILEGML